MVKSVSFLLAVLAMAVCLHSMHAVSAASFNPKAIAQHLDKVDAWTKENLELMKKVKDIVEAAKDGVEKGMDTFHEKDVQGRSIQYSRVTGIIVGDHKLEDGQHGVILITPFPFPFLNEKAFGLLKDEFSTAREFNPKFGPLCTTDLYSPVTLVYTDDDDGTKKKVECTWYKQIDGSMCLGIFKFQK